MARHILASLLIFLLYSAPVSATEVRNVVGAGVVPALATPGEIGINRTDGTLCYVKEGTDPTNRACGSLLLATPIGKLAFTAANAAALATAAGLGATDSPTLAGLTLTGQAVIGSARVQGPATLGFGSAVGGASVNSGIALTVGTGPAQYDNAMTILPTTHATSRRASVAVDDWFVLQDVQGNGTKDFAVTQMSMSYASRLYIGTTGNVMIGGINPGAKLDVAGTMRGQMLVLSAAPTTTNIPASYWTVVKRSDDASVKICANDAGTIKCAVMN